MAEVLLDTTFLLPTLGFAVKEIQEKELEILRSASRSGTRLFCSYVSFVEIFGKLARSKSIVNEPVIEEGICSLLETRIYGWLNPSAEALRAALSLRLKGHKDNIDNILYSIASTSNMHFLSLDSTLKSFLQKNGFDDSVMITPNELTKVISR
jgi:PIN domain nuclease of toxin-antitoxin system